jgi:hypothetical protein
LRCTHSFAHLQARTPTGAAPQSMIGGQDGKKSLSFIRPNLLPPHLPACPGIFMRIIRYNNVTPARVMYAVQRLTALERFSLGCIHLSPKRKRGTRKNPSLALRCPLPVLYLALVAFSGANCRIGIRGDDVGYTANLAMVTAVNQARIYTAPRARMDLSYPASTPHFSPFVGIPIFGASNERGRASLVLPGR